MAADTLTAITVYAVIASLFGLSWWLLRGDK